MPTTTTIIFIPILYSSIPKVCTIKYNTGEKQPEVNCINLGYYVFSCSMASN